jgi:hypothetical protein
VVEKGRSAWRECAEHDAFGNAMEFAFEFLDSRRILMLHGDQAPPAARWTEYLQQLQDKDVSGLGLLVFTNGGAPDPAQRHELNQVLAGRYFARAIVHKSAVVRGVVAAVGWFAPGVAAFRPDSWHAAAAHAGMAQLELDRVARAVRRLHASLSAPIPWLDDALDGGACPPSTGLGRPLARFGVSGPRITITKSGERIEP